MALKLRELDSVGGAGRKTNAGGGGAASTAGTARAAATAKTAATGGTAASPTTNAGGGGAASTAGTARTTATAKTAATGSTAVNTATASGGGGAAASGVGRTQVQAAQKAAAASSSGKTSTTRAKSGGTGSTSSKGSGGTDSTGAAVGVTQPVSAYYNTRGDAARRYQTYLNQLGANLSVDGIWGSQTEAAYQRYKDAFDRWIAGGGDTATPLGGTGLNGGANAGGVDSNALRALLEAYRVESPQLSTEAELRQAARDRYEGQYNADREAALQANARNQQSIEEQLTALLNEANTARAQMAQGYSDQGAALQRLLTARGMGRSTYAGDVARSNYADMNAALQSVSADYADRAQQLRRQGALYEAQTAETLSRLLSDRAANENAYYTELAAAQQERRQAADSAYNGIVQSLMQLLTNNDYHTRQLSQDEDQFTRNLRLGYAKL